jgi:hypothetical protein
MHFHLLSLSSLGKKNLNLVAWLLLSKFLTQYQFDSIFFQVFFFMAKKRFDYPIVMVNDFDFAIQNVVFEWF